MSAKDLFVLTADADAVAVMEAVLARPKFLGIRAITFRVDRYPSSHDATMVADGPNYLREKVKKEDFGKVILLWDYEGSGCETKKPRITPTKCEESVARGLVGATWKNKSSAIAIVPELEGWLWHDPKSIRNYLQMSVADFGRYIVSAAKRNNTTVECLKTEYPKELLEHLFRQKFYRKKVRPDEFSDIASRADLNLWCASRSFQALVTTLSTWFPA